MKLAFFILLLLAAGIVLGKEILDVGRGRREGQDEMRLYRRLRRRAKGLALLVTLFVLAAFFDDFASWGAFTHRTVLLYFALAMTVMVWLLILAARDVRETAFIMLDENRRLRTEALEEIEKEIRKKRGQRSGGRD